MVYRVYVEKKPEYAVEARQLKNELVQLLGIGGLAGLRIVNRYDVEGIDEALLRRCIPIVFSEPPVDMVHTALPGADFTFAVEYLPGQFDQRADSAAECVQLVSQAERPLVRSARVYLLDGDIGEEQRAAAVKYVVNPVEARQAALEVPATLRADYPVPPPVPVLEGFTGLGAAGLAGFIAQYGLAMDEADLAFCQAYFQREGRDPTMTELRMIDTYWSDHCRHTTFGTLLEHVAIADPAVLKTYGQYSALREKLYAGKNKPQTLMDIATIGAKAIKAEGGLKNLDESDEVNACSVKIKADNGGKEEDWLLLFKNETHNHPTEIEPFGGAATCIGGAIRDPLANRGYVFGAMRVTGAGNPLAPVESTLPGKLPQRKLVTTAAAGYSSYGNQIGLATGQVTEIYHPGYIAKRMEIGAVVGAVKLENVRREKPEPGDVVILLGGRTGRDGCGGATGSSKAHKAESLESCGAEVQKGNPPVERKLQRLFRNPAATRLIRRCNDFGAGGVSVAIGELADGLEIDLDAVPKKYDGLDGTELAISESQERMAVVVSPGDAGAFIALAGDENLEATPVAKVTAEPRLKMRWRGDVIVDLARDFLSSNGAEKRADVRVDALPVPSLPGPKGKTLAEKLESWMTDLNRASQKGLAERFDATIGAGSVLMPFGGRFQLTPAQALVMKLPVDGETATCAGMAFGFDPFISEQNPWAGAYLAVVESVAKLAACGFALADMTLTFQEYFERLYAAPARWGKPFAALLGALQAQLDLGVAAIGGKDSMSGSFEKLDVPPTLVSFAVGHGSTGRVVSNEFKLPQSRVVWLRPAGPVSAGGLIPNAAAFKLVLRQLEALIASGKALSVYAVGAGGLADALFKMCLGSRVGFRLNADMDTSQLFAPAFGSFIVELAEPEELGEALGETTGAYAFITKKETVQLEGLQKQWEDVFEPVLPFKGPSPREAVEPVTFTPRGEEPARHHGEGCGHHHGGGYPPHHGHGGGQEAAGAAPSEQGAAPLGNHCHAAGGAQRPARRSYAGPAIGAARPRALIPVFPGTNCEYDTARALRRAGAEPEVFVIRNLSAAQVAESAAALARRIGQSQMVVLPGGFSGGDEPEGSAKLIAAFFRGPALSAAVEELLQRRDGLMLGICNGFQALVKLGLLPFGRIAPLDEKSPTLTFNTIGRHQSMLVRTRVCSTLSPWLCKEQAGAVHTIAVSHGEGRFVAGPDVLEKMKENGQIATQYVDTAGSPTMDVRCNPNGSLWAIEGITSPDGRVLGKMGHTERSGDRLYINVPGNKNQLLFEGGVEYFKV